MRPEFIADLSQPWHVERSAHAAMLQTIASRMQSNGKTEDRKPPEPTFVECAGETDAELRDAVPSVPKRVKGKIAIVPVRGILFSRDTAEARYFGDSYERIQRMFDEVVADPAIGGVVLDVYSPGGMSMGSAEFASHIAAGREAKPIFSIANPYAYSAAYNALVGAAHVSVTPSGQVGSIGTLIEWLDASELLKKWGYNATIVRSAAKKAVPHPFEPLSDEGREILQRDVAHYGAAFEDSVARLRGVSAKVVRDKFGQGAWFNADEAKSLGMVDRVETREQLLARLGAGKPDASKSASVVAVARARSSVRGARNLLGRTLTPAKPAT